MERADKESKKTKEGETEFLSYGKSALLVFVQYMTSHIMSVLFDDSIAAPELWARNLLCHLLENLKYRVKGYEVILKDIEIAQSLINTEELGRIVDCVREQFRDD